MELKDKSIADLKALLAVEQSDRDMYADGLKKAQARVNEIEAALADKEKPQ